MLRVVLVLVSLVAYVAPALAGGVADADAGVARLNAGDASAAADLFTRAIQSKELSPERLARTYHDRGLAFHREGRAGRAILDFTTALWNPNLRRDYRSRVLTSRGLSYEAINDFASAMRDYNLALRLNDEYPEAYANRGNLHRRFGRFELSITDYDLALRNGHPTPKQVFVWQGMSFEGLGRRREAMDSYRRALSHDPQFEAAKVQIAHLTNSNSLDTVLGRSKSGKPLKPVVLSASPSTHSTAVVNELNAAPWTSPASATAKAPAALPVASSGPALRPALEDEHAAVTLQPAPAVLTKKPDLAPAPAVQQRPPAPTPKPAGPKIISMGTPATPTPPVQAQAPVVAPSLNGEGGSDADFALQLGTFKSEELAEKGWSAVLKKASGLVGGLSHIVESVETADTPTAYRLFAEALPDRDAALGLCRTLRDKGIPCIVVRR